MFSLQGGGAVQGNGLDLLPEEGGVDEEENTLDDISGDEVSEVFVVLRTRWYFGGIVHFKE